MFEVSTMFLKIMKVINPDPLPMEENSEWNTNTNLVPYEFGADDAFRMAIYYKEHRSLWQKNISDDQHSTETDKFSCSQMFPLNFHDYLWYLLCINKGSTNA